MAKSSIYRQRCPGNVGHVQEHQKPRLAVCLQLSTIGENPRRRARAITIYPCDECIAVLLKKPGRALRVALAKALQTMWKQLPAQDGAA